MSTYEGNIIPIDKLSDSLDKWISRDSVHDYLKKLADKFDATCELNYNDNHWHRTKFRTILRVNERILLTNRLFEVENFKGITHIDISPLITYLLLTCFDQLGLKKAWMTFDSFLESKKNLPIIKEKLKKDSELNEIERIKAVYSIYMDRYSVKNSFFNFINVMLSNESKNLLLSSIRINISGTINILDKKESTEQEILNYLFKIRNDYTHSSYFTGFYNTPWKDDPDWTFREVYFINNWRYSVFTKMNFIEIIRETILRGISNIIIENKYCV